MFLYLLQSIHLEFEFFFQVLNMVMRPHVERYENGCCFISLLIFCYYIYLMQTWSLITA